MSGLSYSDTLLYSYPVKYQLETIPVHDAWDSDVPCPLCSMMEEAEKRHVEYYLENSVMNPETRVLVNDTGFCSRHFPMMREAGHAHHLGLIAHTHLQQVHNKLSGNIKTLNRGGSAKTAGIFSAAVRSQAEECLICRSVERDLKRYSYTAVKLFIEEEEFHSLFTESRGPCLIHAADLADMAAEVLKKKDMQYFLTALSEHLEESLKELEADVLRFTQKFDSQNDEMVWGNSRDAHARTVQMLSGRVVRLTD